MSSRHQPWNFVKRNDHPRSWHEDPHCAKRAERSGFRRAGRDADHDGAVDVTGSSATTPTNGFRAFVRRRELVIFFALSYLIAWSTLPFGSFLAFAPTRVGDRRRADRRRLARAGSAGSARHSLASELDLVRGCDRPAAARPRGGHRSEHGGRRTCSRRWPSSSRGMRCYCCSASAW